MNAADVRSLPTMYIPDTSKLELKRAGHNQIEQGVDKVAVAAEEALRNNVHFARADRKLTLEVECRGQQVEDQIDLVTREFHADVLDDLDELLDGIKGGVNMFGRRIVYKAWYDWTHSIDLLAKRVMDLLRKQPRPDNETDFFPHQPKPEEMRDLNEADREKAKSIFAKIDRIYNQSDACVKTRNIFIRMLCCIRDYCIRRHRGTTLSSRELWQNWSRNAFERVRASNDSSQNSRL